MNIIRISGNENKLDEICEDGMFQDSVLYMKYRVKEDD